MYKILLADDVKLTLAAEKDYLEGRNLQVFTTTSAHEAKKMASVLQPDLVVLDYHMPDMTGAEVCQQIRDNPQTSHIPVLILSIRDDEDTMRQCTEAGAVGFIRKAQGRDALLENVAKILGVPHRRHVRVPCEISVGINRGGDMFTGLVRNLSSSGMFLIAARWFDTGTALRLKFTLPAVANEIRVLGEVVRSEEITEDDHGFGVQFLEMDPQGRNHLQSYLEKSI